MAEMMVYGMLAGAGALLWLAAKTPYKTIAQKVKNLIPYSWINTEQGTFKQTTFDTMADNLMHPDFTNNVATMFAPSVQDWGVHGQLRQNIRLYPFSNVTQVYRTGNLRV